MNEIAHLIGKPWLMSEGMATLLYQQFIQGRLKLPEAKATAAEKIEAKAAAVHGVGIGSYARSYRIRHSSGKDVALMPVIGTLTKRGEMCSYGMRDYISEIDALNNNEDIHAIILEIEGPGGTVDGTPEFGMAIASSKKPVVAFGDCMVASADYWVASQAKWIVGNINNPTEFGSIGVLCVHEYWGTFIKDNIGEIRIIRAPQSKDKALVNPLEELPKDQEKLIIEDLKQLASQFHDTVKAGRGDRLKSSEKEWGTGKMYKSEEALSLGLIDQIGTIWDAIDKAIQLTTEGNNNTDASARSASQINTMNKVLRQASSFFKRKDTAGAAAASAPTAAEGDAVPMWTADLTFNTDGSADGAFCMHPDSTGADRKFETKIDNNKGNEPPTDPAVTENDNWSLVAEAAAPAATEASAEISTIAKMNETLKKKNAEIISLNQQLASANAKIKSLEDEKKANESKPAAPATTVVSEGDDNKKPAEKSEVEKQADEYAEIASTNLFK